MMKKTQPFEKQPKTDFKELTERILKSYLDSTTEEEMDILTLLDENLSVIGTGKQEFFRNLQEFSQAFVFDVKQRENIHFEWKNFSPEEQKLDENHVLVYGTVLILGSFESGYTCINMDTRFSILYGMIDGIWKVLHIHHSVPDKEQMENEEFPRTLGRRIEESQHMIMALASDYLAVYMIEPEADRSSVVKLDNVIREKAKHIPESFCYSHAFYAYADSRICAEDRQNFLDIVMPEKLIHSFADGRDKMELNYRTIVAGKQKHYSGLYIRVSKPGEPLKLIAGFRNIDDVINIQKEITKSYQKIDEMHTIFVTAKMGTWIIYMLDDKPPAMKADGMMKELLGITGQNLTPEEIYDAWFSNIVPEDVQSVLDSVEKMKSGVRDENTYLWNHPFLGERYVRCGGMAEQVKGGFVLRGYHYDVDDIIREDKKKDEALTELNEVHLRDVMEHAEVISSLSTIYSTIFRAELDTHHYEVLTSIPLMKKVAGSSGNFDEVKENILDSFMTEETRAPMRKFLDIDTLAERLKHTETISTEYKNPSSLWMEARFIVKRRDENGQVQEVLYVARDITAEKMREFEQRNQLSHALEAAQQASKAKSTFLNSMSHDIRTPMNAIIGFTALAQAHVGEQELVRDYLDKISTSGTHLLNLINDVLDMSRIESGVVKLDEKPTHLSDLLQDLRMMVQGLVSSRNQNLHIDMQDIVHEDVITDKLRLNQILINIVGNAIKFTPPGGDIMVCLREKPCSMTCYTTYEFTVKDNGIGMSQEFLTHIFDTFSREYSSTVSGIQGTGLGMAITKNIVDMMGGDITVESEEGKGSLFTVTLNLRHANAAVADEPLHELPETKGAESRKQQYDYRHKHVLLVEDNELNREIAIAILEEMGMTIDSVDDGDVAVAAVNDAPADRYDLIFMDIQMPKMDGYTATREIRTLPDNEKANIPIVAMTANAFEEDKQKVYESGMNGHIIKPISMEAIANVLDTIFSGKCET